MPFKGLQRQWQSSQHGLQDAPSLLLVEHGGLQVDRMGQQSIGAVGVSAQAAMHHHGMRDGLAFVSTSLGMCIGLLASDPLSGFVPLPTENIARDDQLRRRRCRANLEESDKLG